MDNLTETNDLLERFISERKKDTVYAKAKESKDTIQLEGDFTVGDLVMILNIIINKNL